MDHLLSFIKPVKSNLIMRYLQFGSLSTGGPSSRNARFYPLGAPSTALKSEIEWTMYSEMTMPDLCFSFFSSFAVCAVVPLLFIIVFKSELKQASFGRLKEQIEKESATIGDQETTQDANFKLVRTWGSLRSDQPLKDELFGIEVTNALRLSRRVEMY